MPWWIVENTLLAAMLALLVALISRAKCVPPVVRHGLWLVVLIKLIVPPVFSLGISVPGYWVLGDGVRDDIEVASRDDSADLPPETNSLRIGARPGLAGADAIEDSPERELSITDSLEPIILVDNLQTDVAESPREVLPLAGEHATAPVHVQTAQALGPEAVSRPAAVSISPARLLLWGALAGTLLVTLVQLVRLVRLRRMLNRAVRVPEEITALVTDLAAELGVRAPKVRLSFDIASPLVCALGPAVLLWPASRLACLRDSARQAVIVHELAHLARRDHWIGWVELAASSAWWWNPLFWYVRHQLHENAELACDAWVMGMFPEARRAYARALVDLAELDSLETATVPALGVGDGSRKLFERRLVMIMGERVRYRLGVLGFIGMGLLALVALPGCSASLAAVEPVPSDSLPTQNVGVAAPPESLSAPGIEGADPFANTIVLQDPLQPTGTTPALGPQPIALDEPTGRAAPVAESPASLLSEATRAEDPAAVSHDDRLKRLEDRFDALLTELRDLKSSDKGRAGQATPMLPSISIGNKPNPNARKSGVPVAPAADPRAAMGPKPVMIDVDLRTKYHATATGRADGTVDAVTLTRATYKCPAGKAEEIAAFLKENLTDEIEVRVKDQMLQVTASAEDQTAVAGFLRLLQTRARAEDGPGAGPERKSGSGAPKGSRREVPKYPMDEEIIDGDAFKPRKF